MTNSPAVNKEIKQLVLARLQTLNPESKILLMGQEYSVKEMIEEVRNDSEFGKKVVEVQFAYIKMLMSGGLDR